VAEPQVRRARPDDAREVAAILHLSAVDMYDRFAGGREAALRLIERAFRELGNGHSIDVTWVAELDGGVAGAMAAFPVEEANPRARALLRLTLRSIPPWRWPGAIWLFWLGSHASPTPPSTAFYIDALATAPDARRRGVARALLAEAEREARRRRLPAVALDTSLGNQPARALYGAQGFDEVAYQPPGRGLPGFVAMVKRLG
jgi:ribosomal protein S18 acetylase RimI-like enzyme